MDPNELAYSQLQQLLGFGQSLFNTPPAAGAHVGNTYVASSPIEHISNLVRQLVGGYQMGQARQGVSDLSNKILGQRKEYADSLDQASQPVQAPPDMLAAPGFDQASQDAAQGQKRSALLRQGLLSGDPAISSYATQAPKIAVEQEQARKAKIASDAMESPQATGAMNILLHKYGVDVPPGTPSPTLQALLPIAEKGHVAEESARATAAYRAATLGMKGREQGVTTDANGNPIVYPKHGGPGAATPTPAPAPTPQLDLSKLGITPGALDKMAEKYAVEGQLPQGRWGKSSAAVNKAIVNRSDELFPDAHLAANKADYVSNMTSLRKMQTAADGINAFESTGLSNLDNFLKIAHGVVDVGSPLFNKPLREIEDGLKGSPQQAQFNAARQVAIQEISKVLGGAVAGGAVSDSQRHEVEGLMRGDATIPQLEAVASTLKQDMENRKNAVAGQINEIRGRMSGKAAAPVAAPAKKKRWDPAAGKIVED
jgi:hypothetical protein